MNTAEPAGARARTISGGLWLLFTLFVPSMPRNSEPFISALRPSSPIKEILRTRPDPSNSEIATDFSAPIRLTSEAETVFARSSRDSVKDHV